MRLLIVRHATAVDAGTAGITDAERFLTPEGREKFERAAAGLARLVDRPDALLTSPLVRARQTAEIAATAWGKVQPEELEALAGGTFAELARALDGRPGDATVCVVGHEPHASDLLGRLLGSRHGERLSFKKGGAALVDVPGALADGGRLVWFLPPKVLRELA